MKLTEAAFLVGSLGGRPRKYVHIAPKNGYWRGGSIPVTFYLLQEDGISRIILEDGSGFLEIEF